ncbi:hypothetical protein LTV02_19130 [Nocardia yamanashiensis]|nr:hypothetical protein [Nocardia yamanashiensis]UGT45369.1 hypothetical protein LTV02_19130 [Nocardia yamanashiensis]
MGDAEGGDEAVGAGDGDLGDEGLDQRLGLGAAASGDDFRDVVSDAVERCGFRRGGFVRQGCGEFVAPGDELACLGPQFAESSGEELGVEGAVFEGVQVPVDRLLSFGELGGDGVQFDAGFATGIAVASLLGGDGLADQIVPGAVEIAQGFQNGRVDGVGVESGEVALVGVIAGTVEAGVIAVGAGASGGAGADHGPPATWAAQTSGQQIVRGIGGSVRMGFPAGFEDRLGAVEVGGIDDGGMRVGDGGAAEGQLAEVDPAAQHVMPGPFAAGAGAMSARIQLRGDSTGTETVAGVEVEDHAYDHGFGFVHDEGLCGFVDPVSVGPFAALPFAFGGFAFHACDDAVDDGVAFELGEHAQHLHQHAPHGRGGVEWFCGGTEHDLGPVQLVEQGDQVTQAAGEPVDPVDHEHIDESGTRGLQGALQAGPFGARAGSVVGERRRVSPAGLGIDVGGQPGVLGLDGVGLVVFGRGAAGVGPYPHVLFPCGSVGGDTRC